MKRKYIDSMFADYTGVLAQLIPSYTSRPGQIKLAEAIHDAINGNSVLLGEAPTGIGKSLAYLVPAIAYAVHNRRSVLIVTANKALQEQLIEKDLPLLADAFKAYDQTSFTFELVKGRANYLCKNEMWEYEVSGLLSGADAAEAQALSAWAMITTTGDQSDAPPSVSQKTWNAFSVSGDRCLRKTCNHFTECHAERVLMKASAAHVVVANYDLFFSKIIHGRDPMWHRFGAVILDEAHETANIARRAFGQQLTLGTISQLSTDVSKATGDDQLARQLRTTATPFFDEVMRYALNMDTPRVKESDFVDAAPLIDVVDDAMRACRGGCGCGDSANCGTCAHRKLVFDRTEAIIKFLKEFVGQANSDTAYWIEKPYDVNRITAATVQLRAVPYKVGDLLSQLVFAQYPSVVAVSATMTSGGTFDFIREELGLIAKAPTSEPAETEEVPPWHFAMYGASGSDINVRGLRVPTPFDYQKQAKFVVPLGIPWPIPENGRAFDYAAADAIKQLIHDCNGRLLALFTSWQRLKFVAEQLDGHIDYPLLVQGDAPNKALAQMFRDDKHSVMLATKSFWMGLDVQGEALSCLVIDKLPLESFADPLVDMMKERHPDTFWNDFYFPRAAIELAQGAGRLIRSITDRGVFVLLDSRIIGKSYGGMMRRSLPFVGFSKNLADAGQFLAAP